MKEYLVICLILLAVVAALLAGYYIWLSMCFTKGTYGKNKIGGLLRRYSLSRNFKVLDDVTMSNGGQTVTVDHVMVGFFGILFVTVLQGKGEFYGDLKEKKWTFSDNGKKVSFDNPVLANQEKIELFRRIMSQKKIYNLPIEAVVTVVGFGKQTPIYLTNAANENTVFSVKAFRKYLNNVKFEKDNNLDVEELAKVIRGLN